MGAGPAELLQSLLVRVQGYMCMWLCSQSQLYWEGNIKCLLHTLTGRLLDGLEVDLVSLLSSALLVPGGQCGDFQAVL